MPSRKRSNLSQYSSNRKRMRLARSQETAQEREARLATVHQHNADARFSEIFTQLEARLTADRRRHAASRASESSSQRYTRLNADAQRHAVSRVSETFTQREERLILDRERHAEFRASETFTQREARLTADTERHAESRASETFTQREARLTADTDRHAESRASQTFTQREARLTADTERHAESRASETFTQREARLTADTDRHAESRASQTFTQREARLTADAQRHAESRALETITQRGQKLAVDRELHAESRAAETPAQREMRLEMARNNYEAMRLHHAHFLSSERERINEIRLIETQEQRESRLTEDRIRQSLNRMSNSSEDSAESQEYDIPYDELPWIDKTKSGFSYSPRINYAEFSDIGGMIHACAHCQALKWTRETNGMCCSGGKIRLDIFQEPPEPLKSLLNGDHPHSKHYLNSVRSYNAAFQMTSFGAKQIVEGSFMPTFKVQGQVYHLIGSLLPEDEPKFLQIYFVADYCEQTNIRSRNFQNLNTALIAELQNMLHQSNPYINQFKAALQSVPQDQETDYKFVISADRRPTAEHRGRYNAPTTSEVAVVLVDQECDRRDIVLRTHDNRLQRIFETHRAYDTLQYPLIFCRGEDGYNFGLYHFNPTTGETNYNKKVSALQFYSYVLQIRRNRFSHLHCFRSLFSQFIVDMYAKMETERLVYIRTNQRRLRAENYVDLRDAMQQDTNAEDLGRLVILPSSFTGGPRYMHERTQDAFCYVRKYGRPDLFITFTTNPKWNEICQELFDGQASYDRHDIIARVFNLKLKLLINLLTKEKVFGVPLCYMYSVEWQKRGLPHAHILLWLQEKIRPNDVDNIIRAELPDPNDDPTLHEIIKTHMIHGPCGAFNNNSQCMRDGRCTKRYPRAQIDQTITGEDGYPSYRRRSPQLGGFTAEIRHRGQQIVVDNRWVVPYSPVLSKTFRAHINVEMCNSVEAIKYICKYVNKGSDQATFRIDNTDRDEVTRFQSGRYISSSEAVWRILSFPIHERSPPVMHLDVHLEGGQRIYFDPSNVRDRLESPRQTTLLAFFGLCEMDDFAKTLLYDEVPSYYTYDKQRGVFNRRRRGTAVEGFAGVFKDHVIGRVYTVHPNNAESYYLRLLLHTVRGPISFATLRTVNGFEHPTFQAACRVLHLLDDDQHWDNTLSEACVSDSPSRIRHLFSVMLVFCGLSDAASLWQKYQQDLAEDYFRDMRQSFGVNELNEEVRSSVLNRCLKLIQDMVLSIGGNALPKYGLPEPSSDGEHTVNREYAAETSYNPVEIAETLRDGLPNLTTEQRSVFDKVCASVNNNMGELFFVDAPGGTGKTFVTKVILAQIRSQSKIALAVASSGIAATLLPGRKTAHATFRIPIQLDTSESPVCDISRNCEKAKVLRECCLIVWDECTMAHRKAVEALNRTLQDIRQNDRVMGGATVLFSGDFRQTLPVVPRGTRADEIKACLKSSNLWPRIKRLHLTTNMRAQSGINPNAKQFSALLLKIGNGTFPEDEGKITLSRNLCQTVSSPEELITSVFGEIEQVIHREKSWLCERSILTSRNDQSIAINSTILERVEGECVVYTSINQVTDQDEATSYPVEFLNSLSAPGLPAHILNLKVGVPIMLLRNLSPPKLCNGTRLIVTALQRNLVEAEILTGYGIGERVFIPRIPLIPNNFPFRFKRVQFPISVCFAMTINKAQGQTLRTAGVNLTTSCFSHGQLYVALSRVGDAGNLFVFAPEHKTENIVYKEAL